MIYNDVIFGSIPYNKFEINKNELEARLSSGIDSNSEKLGDCIDRVNKAARYKYAYARVPVDLIGDVCDFGFESVKSSSLSKVLYGSNEAIILALSAGVEVDRLISKLSINNKYDAYLTDAIASAAVESFADFITARICTGLDTTKRFSPGYADFPLDFQINLLERLNSPKTVGITLNNQLLMIPMKSITAVIGIK